MAWKLTSIVIALFVMMAGAVAHGQNMSTIDFDRVARESLCTAANPHGYRTVDVSVQSVSDPNTDGYIGRGHGKWHDKFYGSLMRKDTKTSCCNLADCRPTSTCEVDGLRGVKVDGVCMPVTEKEIQNVTAPDLGAHVCAPRQDGKQKGIIYCVVLPPDT